MSRLLDQVWKDKIWGYFKINCIVSMDEIRYIQVTLVGSDLTEALASSYSLGIRCAPFKALYETTDKVVLIKEKFKAARDRQKSYADNRHKPLEFEVGNHELLKVTPWKDVVHFGKKGMVIVKVRFWLEARSLGLQRLSTIIRRLSHKLLRELLPFVKLYSGNIVPRNVLILCIPSPFVIVIVVMAAVIGSWSGPRLYKLYQLGDETYLEAEVPKQGTQKQSGEHAGKADNIVV
ncbi:hypothetical protein Tco_0066610 [Tanacetum coccineum]